MSNSANGLFEAYVNANAYRPIADDRALIDRAGRLVREVVPSSQVRWAGSQRKSTAVSGSDLDLCVESADPVTEARRRQLRERLEAGLGRPASILSHAIRLPAHGGGPKVDIAFANAAFGSRPLPDVVPFKGQASRQGAARALKLWTRSGNLPFVPGWAVETIVLHLDSPPQGLVPLALFLRIVAWLDERASPAALEGVLRPAAFPRWNPDWSARLPGRLEALRNQARALRSRGAPPLDWRSAEDVGRWLRG